MADLLILFGSQTGNAESVAQDVYLAAQAYSVDAQCLGMEKITAQDLAQARDVLLIVSTCGDGDMPDNALPLWQALHTAETPAMQGVHYAVLALGDLLYDHFCAAGKAWDARLDTLGASRLRARVDCDVEFQADATAWTQAILAQLAGLRGWATRNIQPPPRPHTEPGYARDTPLTATLLTRQKLTADHAVREVWHCELDLGSEVAWQPGALLYIWPENDAQLVAQIIAALGARPADQVHWQGRRERLDTLLTHHHELRKPGAELLAALALDAHDGQDVLDCLLARPVLDAQDAVECLKALAPRAYSIANAQQNGNRVHLTVAHVQYERNGRHYHGAASHFLATLPHGGTLRCHLAANRYFTVPDNPASDLIMIPPAAASPRSAPSCNNATNKTHAGATGSSSATAKAAKTFCMVMNGRPDKPTARSTACRWPSRANRRTKPTCKTSYANTARNSLPGSNRAHTSWYAAVPTPWRRKWKQHCAK